jgi:hypothetical protein
MNPQIWFNLTQRQQSALTLLIKTDNPGPSADNQFTIPTLGSGYNYAVEWGDGSISEGVTGDITHTYDSIGEYIVRITGAFRWIFFNFGGDRRKVLELMQFGNLDFTTFSNSFAGCMNMIVTANDSIESLLVTSYTSIFRSCTLVNKDFTNQIPINTNVTGVADMFTGTAMSAENYSRFVIYWANQVHAQGGLPANLNFTNGSTIKYNTINYGGTPYNNAPDAIAYLQSCGWTVTNGGLI